MDFALDEQQTLLRDSVGRFVAEKCAFEQRRAVVAGGGFSAAHWKQFALMGWLGAGLPESAGGYGGSALDTAIIAEQLGRGLVLEPYVEVAVLCAHALLPLHEHSPAAAALGALIDGGCLIVPALQESGAELRRADGGGARLSGRQTMVVGGPRADRFLVAAVEAGGISMLLLSVDTPGLQRHDYRLIDGSPASDLLFDDVVIDAGQRLGAAGGAAPALPERASTPSSPTARRRSA